MDLSDVSIIPLLPPNLAKDKNIRAMCQAFDSELRRLIAGIPGIEIIPSLTRKQITDNLLLDLLAWQFHCDFYSPDMSSEIKQELILKSLDWHTRKGTPSVVEEIVSTVFSKAIILEWFEYGGLPYRFRIATDEQIPDTDGLSKFLHAIKSVKNVRSLLEDIIQLVYFIEELASFDTALYNYEREDIDFFEEKILRDGRVLRDGKTVFNKTVRVLRDGVFKRNGRHGRSGAYTFPGTDIMRLPLTRGSGYRDSLISTLKKPLADIQLGTLPRDGTRPRDGVLPRGWPTAFDTMPPFDLFNAETETLPSSDLCSAAVKKPMSDLFRNTRKRDGALPRDGATYRSNCIIDVYGFKYTAAFQEDVAIDEAFTAGLRKHHYRDGRYLRDGSILRDSMMLLPL